jgi:hypothetical protein
MVGWANFYNSECAECLQLGTTAPWRKWRARKVKTEWLFLWTGNSCLTPSRYFFCTETILFWEVYWDRMWGVRFNKKGLCVLILCSGAIQHLLFIVFCYKFKLPVWDLFLGWAKSCQGIWWWCEMGLWRVLVCEQIAEGNVAALAPPSWRVLLHPCMLMVVLYLLAT